MKIFENYLSRLRTNSNHRKFVKAILPDGKMDINLVKRLLGNGIDLDYSSQLGYALSFAGLVADRKGSSWEFYFEVSRVLLEYGADPRNYQKVPPIYSACGLLYHRNIERSKILELINLLIINGADPNAPVLLIDGVSTTSPLNTAILCKADQIAALLINSGANYEFKSDAYGTSFNVAIVNEMYETVSLMIKKKKKFSVSDKDGQEALSYAKSDKMRELLLTSNNELKKDLGPKNKLKYFEQDRPLGDAMCSWDPCPCGGFGSSIPKGKGYLFIPVSAVEFRKDCLSNNKFQSKLQDLVNKLPYGGKLIFSDVPVLVCDQGIKELDIDPNIAQEDAKYWWETGLIPLRPSPKKNMVVLSNKVESDSITDQYEYIKIGSHTWMTKNLGVIKFKNGDLIPEANTGEEWEKAVDECKPAWCISSNNIEHVEKVGRLYNWYAVNDKRGLAPAGWHIPTSKDYEDLSKTVNWNDNILKEVGQGKAGGEGTNESGFSALLVGFRYEMGYYMGGGDHTSFWSSTEVSITHASTLNIWKSKAGISINYNHKGAGYSVRCIKI